MLGRRRKRIALVLVGAAIHPWLAAAGVALHIEHPAEGHHRPGPESGLAAALHGHHHEHGTPDHQHLLTLPVGTSPPARGTLTPVLAFVAEVPADVATAAVRLATTAAGMGHDPPPAQRSFRILRI
jgi:hypothetical protein